MIIKNAIRSILGSKGRNVLIMLIVVTIASSSCLALTIQKAAQTAQASGMDGKVISAQIQPDRAAFVREANPNSSSGGIQIRDNAFRFDEIQNLPLEANLKLAELQSVSGSYYSGQAAAFKTENFKPIESSEVTNSESNPRGITRIAGTFAGGDFSLTGFSSDVSAKTPRNGKFEISEGSFPEIEKATQTVAITEELAEANSLKVGDSISLTSADSSKTVTLKIAGIYKNLEATETNFPFASMNPSNAIYLSYLDLESLTEELDSTISNQFTFLFSSVKDYENFESNFKNQQISGVDLTKFTVNSADVREFEQSLVPLENLSNFANTFLLVVLIVGGLILVALNLFNIRERKYEIGVYTAIGIRKGKVIRQFAVEMLIVTFFACLVGAGIGTVASVPTANALLQNQVQQATNEQLNNQTQFGRTVAGPGGNQGPQFRLMQFNTTDYVSKINSSVDVFLILKLLGIGIGLSLISSIGGAVFVSRFEPLQILQDRA